MKNKKPLKIAFDASPLLVNKTGIAYYIERLISQLANQYPDEIELVGFYYNFLGRRSSDHFPAAKNIRYRPVRFIPSKVVYQLRRFGIEIPLELLTKERSDFVLFGNFLGYPSIFKTSAVPVVHDLTYLDLPDYVAAKNRSDLSRFVPQQIHRSRFVVTVSDFSKQKIHDIYGVPTNDILVTPIPPEKPYIVSEQTRIKSLQNLGITKPFILFVSTIEPRKNVLALIDAYLNLSTELQEKYTLVITGRAGWNCEKEISHLKEVQEQGKNVIYAGYVTDEEKAALYQSATIYSSPSHYEGFGMTILEAMSYGRPCVLSNISVFKEVAGEAAVYFDQTDIADISAKLTSTLNNPGQLAALSKEGLQQAASFKWEDVAASLYTTIRQHLDK